jgi:hypothetical protein
MKMADTPPSHPLNSCLIRNPKGIDKRNNIYYHRRQSSRHTGACEQALAVDAGPARPFGLAIRNQARAKSA